MISKQQYPEPYGLVALGCRSASFFAITSVCTVHESVVLLLAEHVPERFAKPPHHGHACHLAPAATFDPLIPSSKSRIATQRVQHGLCE